MDDFRICNVEAGMPTVEVAQTRLRNHITTARIRGVKYVKVIHGYGSTGVGGALKQGVLRYLSQLKKEGRVKAYVPGEDWSVFSQTAREILEKCAELKKDRDLNNSNQGITIVLL